MSYYLLIYYKSSYSQNLYFLAVSGKGIGTRGRGAVLGAALGGSIGIPAGMLQDYLVTLLPEDQQRLRQVRVQQTEAIIAGEGRGKRIFSLELVYLV